MFAGGFLIAWGCNVLWGWPAEPRIWLLVGLVLSSFALIGIVIPWPKPTRLVWRLDRSYNLREQVSTAWQEAMLPVSDGMPGLLISDATGSLPHIRNRVLWRGWFLARDLVTLLVVILLFSMALRKDLTVISRQIPSVQRVALPALEKDPTAEEILPLGIPGFKIVPTPAAGSDDQDGQQTFEEYAEQSKQTEALKSALKELGEDLSQLTVSYDTGQALEKGDLDKAAEEMETVADKVDQMSNVSKQDLAEAFQDAAQQMSQIDMETSQNMSAQGQAVASELGSGNSSEAGKAMGQMADELRTLAAQTSPGQSGEDEEAADGSSGGAQEGSTAAGQTGQDNMSGEGIGSEGQGSASVAGREQTDPQPVTRLYGEGETLPLAELESASGILSAGTETSEGEFASGDAVGQTMTGDSAVVTTVLIPYRYQWKWRHVVSEYFSPD